MEEKNKDQNKGKVNKKSDKDFSDITPPDPNQITEAKLNRIVEILKEEGIDVREMGVHIDSDGKIHIEKDHDKNGGD